MNLEIEKQYPNKIIAGIDEAGRGPLSGPVVAACVIVDQNIIIPGINDSKKITPSLRQKLYEKITANYKYAVGIVSPEEIDEINILQATIRACEIAAKSLDITPDIVLVDGNMKFSDSRFTSIIKGDTKSISIASASIIAKVTRDKIMNELHEIHPEYNWKKNNGYGTKEHVSAIMKFGLTEHHRRTFKLKNTGQ